MLGAGELEIPDPWRAYQPEQPKSEVNNNGNNGNGSRKSRNKKKNRKAKASAKQDNAPPAKAASLEVEGSGESLPLEDKDCDKLEGMPARDISMESSVKSIEKEQATPESEENASDGLAADDQLTEAQDLPLTPDQSIQADETSNHTLTTLKLERNTLLQNSSIDTLSAGEEYEEVVEPMALRPAVDDAHVVDDEFAAFETGRHIGATDNKDADADDAQVDIPIADLPTNEMEPIEKPNDASLHSLVETTLALTDEKEPEISISTETSSVSSAIHTTEIHEPQAGEDANDEDDLFDEFVSVPAIEASITVQNPPASQLPVNSDTQQVSASTTKENHLRVDTSQFQKEEADDDDDNVPLAIMKSRSPSTPSAKSIAGKPSSSPSVLSPAGTALSTPISVNGQLSSASSPTRPPLVPLVTFDKPLEMPRSSTDVGPINF
jgi:hypothetical protein